MNPPSVDSGALHVLVVLPALPPADEPTPAPWSPALVQQLEKLLSEGLQLSFLAPACAGGEADVGGVFRFRPGLRLLEPELTAPELMERFGRTLGRPAAAAYWSTGTRKAASLARGSRFDLVHAEWPALTGVIARAAANALGAPLVACTSVGELEGALHEPALLARLEREWETCDLLLSRDRASGEEIRRRAGRHTELLPELEGGEGERLQAGPNYAQVLADAWDRAVLRGPVRSRPGRSEDGADLRNRY